MYLFICFTKQDQESMEILVNACHRKGISTWNWMHDLPIGEDHKEASPKMICSTECLGVLYLLSSNSQSGFCTKELDCAINARKKIFPIHIDSFEIHPDIQYTLSGFRIPECNLHNSAVLQETISELLVQCNSKSSKKALHSTGLESTANRRFFIAEHIAVGDRIPMGIYQERPILWNVLFQTTDDNSKCLLLFATQNLYLAMFDHSSNQWETSALRTDLNTAFLGNCFNESEKYAIQTDYRDNGSIFIPSAIDILQFLPTIADRKSNGRYWLRSPGFRQDCAQFVSADGIISTSGEAVANSEMGVRPMLWIHVPLLETRYHRKSVY